MPVDHLPRSLKELDLGATFNQSIEHLPDSIVSLKLHKGFDQPLDKVPQSLRFLLLPANYYRSCTHLSENVFVLYRGFPT